MEYSLTISGSSAEITSALNAIKKVLPNRDTTGTALPTNSSLSAIKDEVDADEKWLIHKVSKASANDRSIKRGALIDQFSGTAASLNGVLGPLGRRWREHTGQPSPFRAKFVFPEGQVYRINRELAVRICEVFEIKF